MIVLLDWYKREVWVHIRHRHHFPEFGNPRKRVGKKPHSFALLLSFPYATLTIEKLCWRNPDNMITTSVDVEPLVYSGKAIHTEDIWFMIIVWWRMYIPCQIKHINKWKNSKRRNYSLRAFFSLGFRAGSLATVKNKDTKNNPQIIQRLLLVMFFQVSLSG